MSTPFDSELKPRREHRNSDKTGLTGLGLNTLHYSIRISGEIKYEHQLKYLKTLKTTTSQFC